MGWRSNTHTKWWTLYRHQNQEIIYERRQRHLHRKVPRRMESDSCPSYWQHKLSSQRVESIFWDSKSVFWGGYAISSRRWCLEVCPSTTETIFLCGIWNTIYWWASVSKTQEKIEGKINHFVLLQCLIGWAGEIGTLVCFRYLMPMELVHNVILLLRFSHFISGDILVLVGSILATIIIGFAWDLVCLK